MYFNENTASVTPAEMHICGSRACVVLGKVATQMSHQFCLSLAGQLLEEVEKIVSEAI